MENYLVKDLMVPLSEYATVHVGSTLFEAVQALEKAQEEFDHTRYKHRGILIMDKNNRVIGKLSHLHALRALEPALDQTGDFKALEQFAFSRQYVRNLRKMRRRPAAPLEDLCKKAAELKVEDFMHTTAEDESIDHAATMDLAVHQLVQENLLSLLVTKEDKTIGILRLADVFAVVYHTMKECVS